MSNSKSKTASLVESTSTSASWLLQFRDRRLPQEIVLALERDIMRLFSGTMQDGRLVYSTQAKKGGVAYDLELGFEAALPQMNCYWFRATGSWKDRPKERHDYFRKTASDWVDFWIRDFGPSGSAGAEENSPERYAQLSEAALHAEAHLDSITAIQEAILGAMKGGASFVTSHKEGGTILKWANGRFIRSDYGDDPDLKEFSDEPEFLKFLRQFYDWETSAAVYPNKVSDLEAWRLILRKLWVSSKAEKAS